MIPCTFKYGVWWLLGSLRGVGFEFCLHLFRLMWIRVGSVMPVSIRMIISGFGGVVEIIPAIEVLAGVFM